MINKPLVIALCGHPQSGKSEAQRILEWRYGAIPVDDGWPMRDFAIRHLGLSIEDVTTQEGKAKWVELAGKRVQVRWILGEFGNAIEAMFGPDAIPTISARSLEPGKLYCVGSMRRMQGRVWRAIGGLTVKIDNPIAKPSPYEFDWFDESLVDVVLENHALAWGHTKATALADLTTRLDVIMKKHFDLEPIRIGAAS